MKELHDIFCQSSGVSTDSRKITQNCIFFALKGENFNGNHFALQALTQGAKCVVIDEIVDESLHEIITQKPDSIIVVKNVLQTLQALARFHREQLNTKILAVGGSNGKTTTKELIYRVLATKYRTFATQGNFNNHIGVPLTLLQIPTDCEIAIIEIGANHAKEIQELCEIALPDLGVITNIGYDHLEGFGSIEGVAKANGELFDFLAKKDKQNQNQENKTVAFRNTHEDFLAQITQNLSQVYTYPQKNDYFWLSQKEKTFFVEYTRNNTQNQAQIDKDFFVKTHLFGKHNFYNIATALCIGAYFGVDEAKADHAISTYIPTNNRSQILEKNTNTIILDAYNANPSSMQSALEAFAEMQIIDKIPEKPLKKVVILGEMLEMGEYSAQMHENLGEFINNLKLKNLAFDDVVLYGNDMQFALKYLPKAYYFTDKFSLHNWILDKKYTHTHFLVKGSRGAKLETILDFFY